MRSTTFSTKNKFFSKIYILKLQSDLSSKVKDEGILSIFLIKFKPTMHFHSQWSKITIHGLRNAKNKISSNHSNSILKS